MLVVTGTGRFGQRDHEGRATAGSGFDLDGAVMGVDERTRDGEAEPGAAAVGGADEAHELLEHLLAVLGRDARPVVDHPDLAGAAGVVRRRRPRPRCPSGAKRSAFSSRTTRTSSIMSGSSRRDEHVTLDGEAHTVARGEISEPAYRAARELGDVGRLAGGRRARRHGSGSARAPW